MKLNIPPLSQRDSRWASKKLGTSTVSTIGNYGCVLTCHSMMMTYFGHELLPDVLNEVYKTKGVFDQASYINAYRAGTVFEDVKFDEFYECWDVPCDLTKIDNHLNKKMPVIAKVDFDLDPKTQGDWHYVIIIGKTEDEHYLTNDPWTGETYYFDAKYGDPAKNIYGLRIYSGKTPSITTDADTISELQTKIKTLNEQVASLSLENNELRTNLAITEADEKNALEELNKARTEKSALAWEKDQLAIKNKNLQEEIDKLKIENGDLQDKISTLKNEVLNSLTKWELLSLALIKFFGLRKGGNVRG